MEKELGELEEGSEVITRQHSQKAILKKTKKNPKLENVKLVEMDTATRVQIVDETDCISHSTREKYESNYSLSSYGWIVGQTEFFSLGEATSQGEGTLWIQTC